MIRPGPPRRGPGPPVRLHAIRHMPVSARRSWRMRASDRPRRASSTPWSATSLALFGDPGNIGPVPPLYGPAGLSATDRGGAWPARGPVAPAAGEPALGRSSVSDGRLSVRRCSSCSSVSFRRRQPGRDRPGHGHPGGGGRPRLRLGAAPGCPRTHRGAPSLSSSTSAETEGRPRRRYSQPVRHSTAFAARVADGDLTATVSAKSVVR